MPLSSITIAIWIIALLLQAWLCILVVRRGIHLRLPVFAIAVISFAILDALGIAASMFRLHAFTVYAVREIVWTALRMWLLADLCRIMLARKAWAQRLMWIVLGASVLLLAVAGLKQLFVGAAAPGLGLHMWLETAYFVQLAVIASLCITFFQSLDVSFSLEVGVTIGLATSAAADLISLNIDLLEDARGPFSFNSLEHLGMVAASAIWIMFVYANSRRAPREPERTPEYQPAFK